MTNKDLSKLTENDIINLVLYSIYLLNKDPKYATIGELIYTLDKSNFYKFISEFGGTTIKVPTLDEFKLSLKTLLIYQEVISGGSMEEIMKSMEVTKSEKDYIFEMYKVISELVETYNG